VPAHAQAIKELERIVKVVQDTQGWGVGRGERAVYVTSPDKERLDIPVKLGEFNLKQSVKWLEARGLDLAPRKRPAHPDGPPALPEPVQVEEQKAEQPASPVVENEGADVKMYECPECKAAGETFMARAKTGLGAHRYRKHGVVGMGKSTVEQRKRKAADAAKDAKAATEVAPKTARAKPARTASKAAAPRTAAVDTAALLADVDAAWLLMREEIVGSVEGLHDPESVAALHRQNDALKATLDGVRHAIETFPMAKAFAVIADLVSID
jgi:hypothetical protein